MILQAWTLRLGKLRVKESRRRRDDVLPRTLAANAQGSLAPEERPKEFHV